MQLSRYSTYDIRVRAVKAVLMGQRRTEVARAYHVDYSTLFRWCRSYHRKDHFSSLERKAGSGRRPLLNRDHRKWLMKVVMKPASLFGYETDFWTCRRLIQVAETEQSVKISQPTLWRLLSRLGLTYQKPERRYFQADDQKRNKWLRVEVPKIKDTVRKYRAILYFQDESTISLTAVLGKTWAPKGQTPIQRVTGQRGGLAAMSAITQTGKLVFRLHSKRIASKEVIDFLTQLLKHHPRRHVVVVMDQAPPHTSCKTTLFIKKQPRLHLFYLPPYSPDFNPDEQVWNHLKNQELKGHHAKNKIELQALTRRKLHKMARDPHLLRGIFFRCHIANFMN